VISLHLDLDGDGADVLEGGPALVRGLHRHVDLLLPVRLVTVEHLRNMVLLTGLQLLAAYHHHLHYHRQLVIHMDTHSYGSSVQINPFYRPIV
jgi:hypothetical protein